MKTLCVRNLRLSVPSSGGEPVSVLRGVHLDMAAGEILGVVGESGSGKSLTALAIMGLIERPAVWHADAMEVVGLDCTAAGAEELRNMRGRRVAMVFQDARGSLNPHWRIGAQMREVLIHRGSLGRGAAEKKSRSLMDEVGLEESVLQAFPHELSGGMCQRVMLALALALGPQLLIADEPTTALDVTTRRRIIELIRKLARTRNMAVLFFSHDLGVVRFLCDRTAVLYGGRVVEAGDTAQVLEDPWHPYTGALLAARPRFDCDRSLLNAIPGQPPSPGDFPEGCAFAPRCALAEDRCRREDPEVLVTPGQRGAACLLNPAGELHGNS